MDVIKRFNDYFDKIEESLNSPKEIKWDFTNKNEYVGEFDVDDIVYKIEYLKQIGNNWCYMFSFFDTKTNKYSYEVSNRGSGMFTVLSTIKVGLHEMYKKTNPNSIIFSAIDSSNSRKRLYYSFCDDFCKSNDLKLSNRGEGNREIFLMFNDNSSNIEKEEMIESVKKIIEVSK